MEIKKDRLEIKRATSSPKPIVDLSESEASTFEKLRALRREIADANHIPPYVVFSDKTLRELSIRLPKNKKEMLDISGIGEIKFERYGEEFLDTILSNIHEFQ